MRTSKKVLPNPPRTTLTGTEAMSAKWQKSDIAAQSPMSANDPIADMTGLPAAFR